MRILPEVAKHVMDGDAERFCGKRDFHRCRHLYKSIAAAYTRCGQALLPGTGSSWPGLDAPRSSVVKTHETITAAPTGTSAGDALLFRRMASIGWTYTGLVEAGTAGRASSVHNFQRPWIDCGDDTKEGKILWDDPMYVAIRTNDAGAVERLVRVEGHSPSMVYWKSTLILALGQWEAFEALLRAGADPNACHRTGKTALHLAIRYADLRYLEALLAAPGIQVDAVRLDMEWGSVTNLFRTPLSIALQDGFTDAVRLLLGAGADFLASVSPPFPAYRAVSPEMIEVVKAGTGLDLLRTHLLRAPSDPADTEFDAGFRGMLAVPAFSNEYLQATLRAAGDDPPAVLSYATLNACLTPARISLLASDVVPRLQPRRPDFDRQVAWNIMAILCRDMEFQGGMWPDKVLDVLEGVLACPGLLSPAHALFAPALRGVPAETAGIIVDRLCVAAGEDVVPTLRDDEGRTPLHALASSAGTINMPKDDRHAVASVLLKHGVPAAAVDARGDTCLHSLMRGTRRSGCSFNLWWTVSALFEKPAPVCLLCYLVDVAGVDPAAQNADGDTVLHLSEGAVRASVVATCVGVRNRAGLLPIESCLARLATCCQELLVVVAHCSIPLLAADPELSKRLWAGLVAKAIEAPANKQVDAEWLIHVLIIGRAVLHGCSGDPVLVAELISVATAAMVPSCPVLADLVCCGKAVAGGETLPAVGL